MTSIAVGLFGRRGIRLVRQTEVTECGLAVLTMIANYHRLKIDLGSLRRQFAPSMSGTALSTLIAIADQLGFTSNPVRVPLEALDHLHVPAVLHWDMNHFVVLERVSGGRALIHNPAGDTRWIALEEVSHHFTGIALELRPSDDFEPLERTSRIALPQLWRRMTGLKRALLQTLVLSLVMQAFILASPYYMQVAIDQALPAGDDNLLTVLALGFGLFTLINVAASLLRSFVLLSAGTSLSFGIASNLARKLFRLPVTWFERRHVGDILSRFQSIHPIQRAMTETTVAALLDGFLALFTLALMLFYSVSLALVALFALIAYALVRAISFPMQHSAQEHAIVAASKEQSMLIESVRGIVTLRLFNRESDRHAQWLVRLGEATNAGVGLARIGIWQQTLNLLIFGVETILSVWLAVALVMEGGFSIGMVFAYLAYKTQFLTRSSSLIDQVILFRMLGLHLERLSDIALEPQDRSFVPVLAPRQDIRGALELKGVRFRYSPSDPMILDGVDLAVAPGEHIAITGPSGSGKSTLVKIILGLVEPTDGNLFIDGVPLAEFGIRNYQEQIAAVLQDDVLFAGSLAGNIALFDHSPDMARVVAAAGAAAIHHDIERMPMGYETLVGDMGSALSGGQKQRVLLARALYRRPKLLVMDEGTAHLDAATERMVNAAIAELGITRIIVAHRRETISAAERVYRTEGGQLREVDG
jgi:ATP-binding cassette subfamily B protein RaxB